MLKARYGDVKLQVFKEGGILCKKRSCSTWWVDIYTLEKNLSEGFFVKLCICRVGNNFSTSFWYSCWLDHESLKDLFSDLFNLSALQDVSVASMGGKSDVVWS